MIGGMNDGIALALTSSLHIQDGIPLEGSWDNYFYTRQWNTPPDMQVVVMPTTSDKPERRGRARRRAVVRRGRLRVRPGHRHDADRRSRSTTAPLGFDAAAARTVHAAVAHRRPRPHLLRSTRAARTPSSLNGTQVTVDVDDDVRLLWVLRDLLGVTGPKYGCGLDVCKACTCHINGKAFNPCSVPVARHQADRRDHHHRGPAGDRRQGPAPDAAGLAGPRRRPVRLLPARPDHGRGGQGATGRRRRAARSPTPTSTSIRNICRCGTYSRIREAIKAGAENM